MSLRKISESVEPFSLQEELASQLKIENVNLLLFSPLFKGTDSGFLFVLRGDFLVPFHPCRVLNRPAPFINCPRHG